MKVEWIQEEPKPEIQKVIPTAGMVVKYTNQAEKTRFFLIVDQDARLNFDTEKYRMSIVELDTGSVWTFRDLPAMVVTLQSRRAGLSSWEEFHANS